MIGFNQRPKFAHRMLGLALFCGPVTWFGQSAAVAAAPQTQPAAAAPQTQPAVPPQPKINEQFLAGQRSQRDSIKNRVSAAAGSSEVDISQVAHLAIDHGLLKLDAVAPIFSLRQTFRVKGANAVVNISRTPVTIQNVWGPNGVTRQAVSNTTIQRSDAGVTNDSDVWQTYMSTNGIYFSISGQSVLGQVIFSQSNIARRNVQVPGAAAPGTTVSITVHEWQAMGGGIGMKPVFQATAGSLLELRAKNPEEFRKYLMPLFAKVSDLSWLMPGATDVYSVFSDIAADPQMTAKIDALLPDLDSDAFPIRDMASSQLLELGPTAVLAALRHDPNVLSSEQQGQLGRLLAAHRRREVDPGEARKDVAFLTDCLEFEDPTVRKAAKSALSAMLGEPLTIDTEQKGESLAKSVDALRAKLAKDAAAAQPATQPAAGAPAAIPAAGIVVPAVARPLLNR